MGRRIKAEGEQQPKGPKYNGLYCKPCVEEGRGLAPQWLAPDGAGVTCDHGDGGAEGVTGEQAQQIALEKAQKTAAEQRSPEPIKTVLIEVSENLEREQRLAELADSQKKARERVVFGSANAAKKSEMRPDFKAFVETIWVEDIAKEAKQLIEELQLGELRSDRGSVVKALDRAEDNARRAHGLYVTCVREREAWEKRNDVIFAGMRVEANKYLQKEKEKGQRNKAITDKDIDDACALLFGDEWIAQEKERKDYELAEKQMKNIAERWESRCKTLAAINASLR